MTNKEALEVIRNHHTAEYWQAMSQAVIALKRTEAIMCKDCNHYDVINGENHVFPYCREWLGETERHGYCHKAERKDEDE